MCVRSLSTVTIVEPLTRGDPPGFRRARFPHRQVLATETLHNNDIENARNIGMIRFGEVRTRVLFMILPDRKGDTWGNDRFKTSIVSSNNETVKLLHLFIDEGFTREFVRLEVPTDFDYERRKR